MVVIGALWLKNFWYQQTASGKGPNNNLGTQKIMMPIMT